MANIPRSLSELLLPPELRNYGGNQYATETDVTGDDEVTGVIAAPRDFARGGQAGALRPTGRQAGLVHVHHLLVPYLDQTTNSIGFQPANVQVQQAVSSGVCDRVLVSMARSINSAGSPYLAFSVDNPVSVSNLTTLGGGCVPVAQYYGNDLTVVTVDLQPGRHYVEAIACFLTAQGGASILTPVSVTFVNTRGVF